MIPFFCFRSVPSRSLGTYFSAALFGVEFCHNLIFFRIAKNYFQNFEIELTLEKRSTGRAHQS